jgi:protein SCO1/2
VQTPASCQASRPRRGPYAHHFPNLIVQTHDGQRAWFYDDLLRGRIVMVNCMSTRNGASAGITGNLARVQRLIGDRLGRDVFMYSITTDPAHDTPRVLRAFADRHEVGRGWTFLTGDPAAIALLRGRLFVDGGGHDHGAEPAEDCSLALLRYGNEAVGLWGAVPAMTHPARIVQRLSWIQPAPPAAGMPRRAGPMPLAGAGAR